MRVYLYKNYKIAKTTVNMKQTGNSAKLK